MRHVGDPRLGATALGHVQYSNEECIAATECNAAAERQHLDLAAIGADVAPTARLVDIADRGERLIVRVNFLTWPDIADRHVQELLAAVAVVADGRIIDAEEPPA